MAQYFINSSTGTSGWTNRIMPSGSFSQNGLFLQLNSPSAGTKVVSYNSVDGITDNIEILVNFYFTNDVGKHGIASLRYSGTNEATTKGYTLSASFISSQGHLAIDEGSTGYVVWTPWNYLPNVRYWARFRIDGNRLRAKVWNDGNAEPGWMIDATNNVTTTGVYNGVHTYAAGNVMYNKIGFGTDGDSAPMFAITDKAQTGNFRVNVIPTTADAAGYSGGYGGIAGYGQTYGHAFTPTSTINDKNQTGVFRVKKTLDQTQVGKFRIRKEFTQNQIGQFRVKRVWDKPQVGNFRIASEPSRPQVGKFRVQIKIERNISGAFKVAIPSEQPQIGKFRVQTVVDKNVSGKFRVLTYSTKDQIGNFRVTSKTDKIITGQFRVKTTSQVNQVGRFQVRRTNDKHITGSFRVEYIGLKHQTGKFRIYGRNTLPEVFVPVDRYVPKKESDGIVSTAEVTSGNVYAGYGTSGDVEVGSIDASGDYNPNGISSGRIYSNNEHVILLWDDGSIWISEQNEEIMVEEYEEGGIMSMIPKKGTFYEGTIEHGDIQESL